ncbi:kyphoscoliosis peptidase-like isoform X2 [Haliotis asinina]|uniref:kyphoscoliosis peptidase-like isoform X2 n=1 Tax=Haliotis asinina TaxID=109174 RepID=UPI003532405A
MGCVKSKQVGVLEQAAGQAEPISNDPRVPISPHNMEKEHKLPSLEELKEESKSEDSNIQVSPAMEQKDLLPCPEEPTSNNIPVSLEFMEEGDMLSIPEGLTEEYISHGAHITVSPASVEKKDTSPSPEGPREDPTDNSNISYSPNNTENMEKEDVLPCPEVPREEPTSIDRYVLVIHHDMENMEIHDISPSTEELREPTSIDPNVLVGLYDTEEEDVLPSPEEPTTEPTSHDPNIPVNRHKMKHKRPVRSQTNCAINDISPPVKPPNTKKKDAVPSPEEFAAIDAHTLKTPASVCTSVTSLVRYLVKPARSDMEKVRAFYRWIADNISYDTSGNSGAQDAEAVLKRGSCVCEGYASLFQSLCDKAFGYDAEIPFTLNTQTDHAWNIVYVQDEWRPIECTWGAGHLTNNRTYEKKFEEFYFLTDPEDFVIKHLPYVDKNVEASIPLQLLKNPYTLEKFNNALCPTVDGIKWRFECTSHKTQVITVDKECEITFKTQNVKLSGIMCHLKEKNTQQDYTQYVLLRKQGDKYTAKITPPKESKYNFGIYGKPHSASGPTHNWMITFVLRCQSVAKDLHPYPDKKGYWGASEAAIQYGFTSDILGKDVVTTSTGEAELRIETSQLVPISLRLAQAESNHDLDRYVFGFYEGNTLVIKARVPRVGFYKLSLFGKRPENFESTTLSHVADFLIDSRKSVTNVLPFPRAYTAADNYGCQLLEPLSGDLPANQDVQIKLTSDSLTELMVNNQVREKEGKEFNFIFRTPSAGEELCVFGTNGGSSSFSGLYMYKIV